MHSFADVNAGSLHLAEVVTSWYLDAKQSFSFGLLDVLNLSGDPLQESLSSVNIWSVVAAYDLIISENWAFGVVMVLPKLLLFDIRDDVADIELTSIISGPETVFLGMTTFTYSEGRFNVEFGALPVYSSGVISPLPYVNLWWRY